MTNINSSSQATSVTLRDEDIKVERTLGRRSFLAATGMLLGTAAALVTGCSDPDRKRPQGAAAQGANQNANSPPQAESASDPDSTKTAPQGANAPAQGENAGDPDRTRSTPTTPPNP